MFRVKSSLINQVVTGERLNTILESRRLGTRKQYQTCVSASVKFCSYNSVSPMNPTLQQVLEFLSFQSKTVGYSAVAFVNVNVMKGVPLNTCHVVRVIMLVLLLWL